MSVDVDVVPVSNPGAAALEQHEELLAATARVLTSNRYILGPEVEAFEREFATYLGADHVVGVGSGVDAIVLTLRALGVGSGNEVLVPAYTAVATWMAIDLLGATPVGVEIDPTYWTMDVEDAARRITPRTAAIVPVHLFGQAADLTPLLALAAAHDVPLLEDTAQAHGATLEGAALGTRGIAGAYSFYPTKNLGGIGDGGAIATGDAALAEQLRLLRTYGWKEAGTPLIKGYNSRLDELQAALLRVKLASLARWTDRRREIAARYTDVIGTDGVLRAPTQRPGSEHVFHLYVVDAGERRAAIRARLLELGVQTLVHYEPLPHVTPAYLADGHRPGEFPVAEALASGAFSLPMFPQLTDAQVDRVVAALGDVLA